MLESIVGKDFLPRGSGIFSFDSPAMTFSLFLVHELSR